MSISLKEIGRGVGGGGGGGGGACFLFLPPPSRKKSITSGSERGGGGFGIARALRQWSFGGGGERLSLERRGEGGRGNERKFPGLGVGGVKGVSLPPSLSLL